MLFYTYRENLDSRHAGLAALILDPSGQVAYGPLEVRAESGTLGPWASDLAWNPANNQCLAVWTEGSGEDTDVWARRIDPGTPGLIGNAFMVSTASSTIANTDASVGVIDDGSGTEGKYLVVWTSFQYTLPIPDWNYDVLGRVVEGLGGMVEGPFAIAVTPARQYCSSTAGSQAGQRFFTAYVTNYEGYQNDFFMSGKQFSVFFELLDTQRWLGIDTARYSCPSTVAGEAGDFLIVFNDKAPGTSYLQAWATLIGNRLYLPLIKK